MLPSKASSVFWLPKRPESIVMPIVGNGTYCTEKTPHLHFEEMSHWIILNTSLYDTKISHGNERQ